MKKILILFAFFFSCLNEKKSEDRYGNLIKDNDIKDSANILNDTMVYGKDLDIEFNNSLDYDKLQVAFLIDGYSNVDTDEFLKKGLLNTIKNISYLGVFLLKDDIQIGKINPNDKKITLELLNLYENIQQKEYDDLAIILGDIVKKDKGDKDDKEKSDLIVENDEDYFINYRKIIPITNHIKYENY